MHKAGEANLDDHSPSRGASPASSAGSTVLGSPGCSPSHSCSMTPANRKERSRSQSNSAYSLFSQESQPESHPQHLQMAVSLRENVRQALMMEPLTAAVVEMMKALAAVGLVVKKQQTMRALSRMVQTMKARGPAVRQRG